MQKFNRAGRVTAVLAALALTAACGTTVSQSEQLAAQRRGGDGLSPVGTSFGAETSFDPVTDGGTATTVARTANGAVSATATTIRRTTASTVADKTPIKIGAFYIKGGNELLATALKGTPVNFGDGQLEAKAVVEDINKHGGVGGRPIELHMQGFNANDSGNPEAFQAACVALIDDKKVFAIMSIFNIRSDMAECAAKRKTFLLSVALGAGDDFLYKQYADWVFSPAAMSLNTEQKLVIANAAATGVISKTKKVGVLLESDDEQFVRVFKTAIEPALKALKIPYESFTLAAANDTAGISNAVLKFASSGVDVVQFSLGAGGVPELLFMQTANTQGYQPKYIMGDSTNTWFVGNSAPRAQVRNITGVGSYPMANVNASQVPSTPGEKKCLEVISAAGEDVKDRQSSLTATFYCEMFYGFAAAGSRVAGKMTADGWRNAYRTMGPAYPSMITFAADVTRTPNAPAVGYRPLGWSDGCSCITYTGPLQRLA